MTISIPLWDFQQEDVTKLAPLDACLIANEMGLPRYR